MSRARISCRCVNSVFNLWIHSHAHRIVATFLPRGMEKGIQEKRGSLCNGRLCLDTSSSIRDSRVSRLLTKLVSSVFETTWPPSGFLNRCLFLLIAMLRSDVAADSNFWHAFNLFLYRSGLSFRSRLIHTLRTPPGR